MKPISLILPGTAAALVAVLALLLAGGQSSAAGPSTVVAKGSSSGLLIMNYKFAPAMLTVKAGATVTVKNTDPTAHTASATSGSFDSGTLATGQTAKLKLIKPGVYKYYCKFHAFMVGTITVVR